MAIHFFKKWVVSYIFCGNKVKSSIKAAKCIRVPLHSSVPKLAPQDSHKKLIMVVHAYPALRRSRQEEN